jgi:hypothetical protein
MSDFRYGDLIGYESSTLVWRGLILGPSTKPDIHGRSYVSVLILRDDDNMWEIGEVQEMLANEMPSLLIGRVTV